MPYIDDFLDVYKVTSHKQRESRLTSSYMGAKKETELTKLCGDEPLPRDWIKLEVVNRMREKYNEWTDRTRGVKRRKFQSGKLVRGKFESNEWSDPQVIKSGSKSCLS